MTQQHRRVPFPYTVEIERFDISFRESLRIFLDAKRAQLIPAENVQTYYHGTSWRTDLSGDTSEMQAIRHQFEISFDDIIAHNLDVMQQALVRLANDMHESIMASLYSVISQTAGATGNTISVKDAGSHAQAFLEALRQIEFGVDRHGKPSLPQFHASPEMVDAFLRDLEQQGPEYESEVRRIIEEKAAAAQAREEQRLSRFTREA